jgi:large subunit ribosomal protein L6
MSRIGKKPVSIPSGVTANVEGQTVKIKGPKGTLQVVLHDDIAVAMDKGVIKVDPRFPPNLFDLKVPPDTEVIEDEDALPK